MGIPIPGKTVFILRRGPDSFCPRLLDKESIATLDNSSSISSRDSLTQVRKGRHQSRNDWYNPVTSWAEWDGKNSFQPVTWIKLTWNWDFGFVKFIWSIGDMGNTANPWVSTISNHKTLVLLKFQYLYIHTSVTSMKPYHLVVIGFETRTWSIRDGVWCW